MTEYLEVKENPDIDLYHMGQLKNKLIAIVKVSLLDK